MIRRGAAIALTLAPLTGPSHRFEGDGVIEKNVEISVAMETIALEALDEASRTVGAAIALADARDAKVIEALTSDDRGLKKRAIVMAGDRRLKDAVPALTAMLRDENEDPAAVLKAIGALVSIGDDRAVGALIDAGRQRSTAYLSQILFAVASLGGKEAEAYLFTVSNGHADPTIRKNAADALEELERRKEAKEKDSAKKPE
jgi:HEAT repeat protein